MKRIPWNKFCNGLSYKKKWNICPKSHEKNSWSNILFSRRFFITCLLFWGCFYDSRQCDYFQILKKKQKDDVLAQNTCYKIVEKVPQRLQCHFIARRRKSGYQFSFNLRRIFVAPCLLSWVVASVTRWSFDRAINLALIWVFCIVIIDFRRLLPPSAAQFFSGRGDLLCSRVELCAV